MKQQASKLKELSKLDHGVAWKVQKATWLLTALALTLGVGLALYKPFALMNLQMFYLGIGGFTAFSLFFNIGLTVFHKLEGHNKRAAHGILACIVFTIVIAIGVALLFLVSSSMSNTSTSISAPLGISKSTLSLTMLIPYYVIAASFIISLTAASFFYEDVNKFSVIIPILPIVIFLAVSGLHYIEAGSAANDLNSYQLSKPFNEGDRLHEKQLLASRTAIPPMNRVTATMAIAGHGAKVHTRLNRFLSSDRYKLPTGCAQQISQKLDGSSMNSVFRMWKFSNELMNRNKDAFVEVEMTQCNASCSYTEQQARKSLTQLIKLEEARLKRSQDILNTNVDLSGVDGCKLERTTRTPPTPPAENSSSESTTQPPALP